MNSLRKACLADAMNGDFLFTENGLEFVKPDLLQRTFTVYVGNGFVDASRNTPQGQQDVNLCAAFLGEFCYRPFHGGQMEQVLDDLVAVSYIPTPAKALEVVYALRAMGVKGRIGLEVEYGGHAERVKDFN